MYTNRVTVITGQCTQIKLQLLQVSEHKTELQLLQVSVHKKRIAVITSLCTQT